MAELTRSEKINQIIKTVGFERHIDLGDVEITIKQKYPDFWYHKKLIQPSPYDTLEELKADPNYRLPAYLWRSLSDGPNGARKFYLIRHFLDVTGYTEVPMTDFEFYPDGYYCRGLYLENPYGYFLFEGKCYISPENQYWVMTTQITLQRFKEVVAIKEELLNADPTHCESANMGWKRWVLTNYAKDEELDRIITRLQPVYDRFMNKKGLTPPGYIVM